MIVVVTHYICDLCYSSHGNVCGNVKMYIYVEPFSTDIDDGW